MDKKRLTWEQLHDVSDPLCIRSDIYHIATLYEVVWDKHGIGFDMYTKLSKWAKSPFIPTERWLN